MQAAQRGRESLYEIAESLMRLCVQVKENQPQEPLGVLVDFLKSGGRDRGIFLDLKQEERKILEQALNLEPES